MAISASPCEGPPAGGDMLTQTQSVPEQWKQPLLPLPLVHARLVPLVQGGQEYDMRESCNEVIIGRAPECQVVLEDKRVSKQHVRIYRGGKCQYFVEQLGSNGCFINEVCLKKGDTRSLQHGDEISLCMHAHESRAQPFAAYIFRIPGSPGAGGTAASAEGGQRSREAIAAAPRPQPPASADAGVAAAATQKQEVSEQWVLQNWDMRLVLGKGYFSEVWVGLHVPTGSKRAVKVVDKAKFSTFKAGHNSQLALSAEAEMLTRLEHPGIVRVYEWFETRDRLYLVMELLDGGDLLDYVIERGCLPEAVARRWFLELCMALEHLHSRDIVHRDLKPENILLTARSEDAELKIADFGLARRHAHSQDCRTFCGTPQYFAPEVISTFRERMEGQQASGYGKQVDVWGLGVILYIILSGVPPFGEEGNTLYEQILEGRWEFDVPAWESVTPEAKDLVRQLMRGNPRERITVQQALEHPWLVQLGGETQPAVVVGGCARSAAAVEAEAPPPPKRRRTANAVTNGQDSQFDF